MSPIESIAGFGYPLDSSRIEDIDSFIDTDTLYGHDLIIWDVEGTEGLNRITAASLNRRSRELAEHLEAGRPLVVMLPSGPVWSSGIGDHIRLPDEVLPFDVKLTPAKGTNWTNTAGTPEFRALCKWCVNLMQFESYMEPVAGLPLMHIKNTTRVVASVVHHGAASVLFLPRFSSEVWYDEDDEQDGRSAADYLLDLIIDAVESYSAPVSLPEWTDRFALPGESDAIKGISKDERTIERATARVSRSKTKLSDIRERKALIVEQGPALERVAERAFLALGFDVAPGEPGRADRVLKLGNRTAVVEIKGKGKSAAERDATQLDKWVSGYRADNGRKAKGILLVNGWRNQALEKRDAVFPPSMLKYARDEREQCLVTGLQLLGLWLAAEAGGEKEAKKLANLLMRTKGPLNGYDDPAQIFEALGDVEPDAD